MVKTKQKRLTIVQREILGLLNDGHVMQIDRMNMASIGDRNVAPQTRYFLTQRRYIKRKDKTKSVESLGNGFVITNKGRKALLDTPLQTRKKTPVVSKKEKKCAGCGVVKPIEDFVTIYGYTNPRGKYCRQCFVDREQGFVRTLLEGRDFCLYCGKPIAKAYDRTPEGKSTRTYINLDHMDPLCLGGEHSSENIVYCCIKCNERKGSKAFIEWLKQLKPPCKELARQVYEEKHGRSPEEFEPEPTEAGIFIDLTCLQEEH